MSLRKVCIVGFSPNSRHDAPYGDESFEFWGMNNLHAVITKEEHPEAKWDAWFDMHEREYISLNNPGLLTDHEAWLKGCGIPVYMQQAFPDFPTSVAYPLAEVQERMVKDWGFAPEERTYFHSSFAYPVALALHQGVDEIHVYGIDMAKGSEYDYQRPNAEGWICLARQQPALSGGKVRVVVSNDCALMKGPGLYGYQAGEYAFPMRLKRSMQKHLEIVEGDFREKEKALNKANAEKVYAAGYAAAVREYVHFMDDLQRGVQLNVEETK